MHAPQSVQQGLWSNVGLCSALWLARELGFVCWEWIFLLLFSLDFLCKAYFSLAQLTFDLTGMPTMSNSSRHRSSISLPRNHVRYSFRRARQLWTLNHLLSPCDCFEKRRRHQRPNKSFSASNRQAVHFILPIRSVCTSRLVLSMRAAVQRVF